MVTVMYTIITHILQESDMNCIRRIIDRVYYDNFVSKRDTRLRQCLLIYTDRKIHYINATVQQADRRCESVGGMPSSD
jgi:hypothetical protein